MATTRKRMSTLPATAKAVRAWLKGNSEGRALLAEITETLNEEMKERLAEINARLDERLEERCCKCPGIRPGKRVLVVLRRLGNYPGAEVYAEKGASVKFLELPDAPDDAECGPLLEALAEVKLRKSWRYMLQLPESMIQREVFRAVSLEETLWRGERLDFVRWLRETRT